MPSLTPTCIVAEVQGVGQDSNANEPSVQFGIFVGENNGLLEWVTLCDASVQKLPVKDEGSWYWTKKTDIDPLDSAEVVGRAKFLCQDHLDSRDFQEFASSQHFTVYCKYGLDDAVRKFFEDHEMDLFLAFVRAVKAAEAVPELRKLKEQFGRMVGLDLKNIDIKSEESNFCFNSDSCNFKSGAAKRQSRKVVWSKVTRQK